MQYTKENVIKCQEKDKPTNTDYCSFLCPYLQECVIAEMDKFKEEELKNA